jgi:tight adherence protein B
MNLELLWAASILAGLAVAVAVWAGRAWLLGRWERDIAWIHDTHARFYPESVDARLYVLGYYAGFLVLLLLLLAFVPSMIAALFTWIASWFLPNRIIAWAWKRRLARIDLQIPQAVSSLANSMRAGLSLVQAIGRLAEQAPEPIRSEFRIMANQYAFGADMETVIRNAKTRLNLPNFSLFASALMLNREMGGDISETLTRISQSLDKLREMRKTVEAHTSEGRANIKVLLVAPVFMLAVMSFVMPHGVRLLFTTVPGWALLTIAGLLAGAGIYFAQRITRSEI